MCDASHSEAYNVRVEGRDVVGECPYCGPVTIRGATTDDFVEALVEAREDRNEYRDALILQNGLVKAYLDKWARTYDLDDTVQRMTAELMLAVWDEELPQVEIRGV